MNIENKLSDFLTNISYESIPNDAVSATKSLILNSISAAFGGSSADGIKELTELVNEWGGKTESNIICYHHKVPAPNAAQVNASMIHALDFDDTHSRVMLHAGAVSIPAALAIAEMIGGISGKQFITAITLAVDIGCRMCLVTNTPPDIKDEGRWLQWHFTSVYGYFVSAAVAGRLLCLDSDKMTNALGLAYHQASGNMQALRDGALAKRMGPGFASRGGIVAALMAQKGISGAKNFIEGKVAFYELYHPKCYHNIAALTDGLGEHFENSYICPKPYPCGAVNHPFIDAAIAIRKEYNILPEDVSEITIYTGEMAQILWQPLESKCNPKSTVEMQFSLPWSVATAIAKGRASINDYRLDALNDPIVNSLCRRVKAQVDQHFTREGIEPGKVKIRTTDGRELTKQVNYPLGSPDTPFSSEDYMRKLKDCNSASLQPMSDSQLNTLADVIWHLEELRSVEPLYKLLS